MVVARLWISCDCFLVGLCGSFPRLTYFMGSALHVAAKLPLANVRAPSKIQSVLFSGGIGGVVSLVAQKQLSK